MSKTQKICMFDIETTNLNADFGFMLCASWKFVGEKEVHTASIFDSPSFIDDPTDDKHVVAQVAQALNSSDVIVGHYSKRFDFPYIQARLLFHGLPTMDPRKPHVDTWHIARYKLKLHSNRLQSITEHLGFEDKTPIKSREWIRAMSGDVRAIQYVIDHCEQDVLVLEHVYHKLKPLMTNHPNVNLVGGITDACPTCGSHLLTKQGWKIARVRRSQQYKCKACGSWCQGPSQPIEGVVIR